MRQKQFKKRNSPQENINKKIYSDGFWPKKFMPEEEKNCTLHVRGLSR